MAAILVCFGMVGWLDTKPFNICTSFGHPKSEHVPYLSPHCIFLCRIQCLLFGPWQRLHIQWEYKLQTSLEFKWLKIVQMVHYLRHGLNTGQSFRYFKGLHKAWLGYQTIVGMGCSVVLIQIVPLFECLTFESPLSIKKIKLKSSLV